MMEKHYETSPLCSALPRNINLKLQPCKCRGYKVLFPTYMLPIVGVSLLVFSALAYSKTYWVGKRHRWTVFVSYVINYISFSLFIYLFTWQTTVFSRTEVQFALLLVWILTNTISRKLLKQSREEIKQRDQRM